jgi:hypothetical protein
VFTCYLGDSWLKAITSSVIESTCLLSFGADLLSYSLLYKNTNIKIYRTVIVLLFCMGVKLGLSH